MKATRILIFVLMVYLSYSDIYGILSCLARNDAIGNIVTEYITKNMTNTKERHDFIDNLLSNFPQIREYLKDCLKK